MALPSETLPVIPHHVKGSQRGFSLSKLVQIIPYCYRHVTFYEEGGKKKTTGKNHLKVLPFPIL